jgi:hypothetical protein
MVAMTDMSLQEVIDGLRSGVGVDMQELIDKLLTNASDAGRLKVLENAVDDGTFESWPMSLGLANYLEDILSGEEDIQEG